MGRCAIVLWAALGVAICPTAAGYAVQTSRSSGVKRFNSDLREGYRVLGRTFTALKKAGVLDKLADQKIVEAEESRLRRDVNGFTTVRGETECTTIMLFHIFTSHMELTQYMAQCSAEEEANEAAGGEENIDKDVDEIETCDSPCFLFMSGFTHAMAEKHCTLNVERYYLSFLDNGIFHPNSNESMAMGQMVQKLKYMDINRIPSSLLQDVATTFDEGCNELPNGMSCFQEGRWLNASYRSGNPAARRKHQEACSMAEGIQTDPAMQQCVCVWQHVADLYNGIVDNPDNQWCNGNVRSTTPPPDEDICTGMPWDQVENFTMTNCNHTVQNAFVDPNCTKFLACNHGIGQCITTIIDEIQGANTPPPGGGSGGGSGSGSTTMYIGASCGAIVLAVTIVAGYIIYDKKRRGGVLLRRAGPRYAQVGAGANNDDDYNDSDEDL